MKKKKYVDNKKFLEVMVEFKSALKEWEDSESVGVKPRIPDYAGECIYKIATHLAKKPNFKMYTYIDDMIGDGIENCILYIDKFDPEKSSNPFSYFTQIIFYAFLRRIAAEKKQSYIKYKSLEMFEHDLKTNNQHKNLGALQSSTKNEIIRDMIDTYELKNNITGKKTRKKTSKKENRVIVDAMVDNSIQ